MNQATLPQLYLATFVRSARWRKCLQETRLLFKWLRCRFANKMQITGSTVRVGRWWAWEHERWLLEDWHALSRRSPQHFQWEMGWSNWLGNQLDAVMRKIDTCEVIKDVFTSSDGFIEQVIDLKRNHEFSTSFTSSWGHQSPPTPAASG